VKELKALRQKRKTKRNIVVPAGRDVHLKQFGIELMELEVRLAPGAATRCGVKVCCSDDGREETSLYYDAAERKLVCDTTRSGLAFGRKTVEGGPFVLAPGEPLKLRVFVDRSIVEVYANDRQAVARAVYPTLGGRGVKLFARGGDATVTSVTGWELMPSNAS
jgi:beta-fructofuranosidase